MSAREGGEAIAGANAAHVGEVTQRLVAALEKLAPAYEVPEGSIPYRVAIPGIARDLQRMPRGNRRLPSGTAPKAVALVARMVSALRELESLSGLTGDPADATVHLARLPRLVAFRFIAMGGEAADLAKEIEASVAPASGKRGRRPATAAYAIAARLYQETERLTGRRPGRSVVTAGMTQTGRERGAFVTLVREVFGILGVTASAEEAARAAIESTKPMGSNQE